MAALAEGLGVQIKVFHTSRLTSLGDKIADDLSKGKVDLVRPLVETDMSHRVSKVLMAWLNNPRVSMELGRDVHVSFCYATAAMEMGVLGRHGKVKPKAL
jgi:hypothetical protein